jgi:hypothetical protein
LRETVKKTKVEKIKKDKKEVFHNNCRNKVSEKNKKRVIKEDGRYLIYYSF